MITKLIGGVIFLGGVLAFIVLLTAPLTLDGVQFFLAHVAALGVLFLGAKMLGDF